MCSHDGLIIGEKYLVTAIESICDRCSSPAITGDCTGIWRGHVEIDGVRYGLFDYLHRTRCPSCGRTSIGLQSPCDYYQVETSVEVPDWPVRQEATK